MLGGQGVAATRRSAPGSRLPQGDSRLQNGDLDFWQDGFHDRCIRPHEDIHEYVTYIHMNPVRAGLAEHPEDWPWSSAHADYREKVRWE